jgi:phosphatidylglycerophosphatase B
MLRKKKLLISFLIAWLCLLILVWGFPIAFTTCLKNSWQTNIALLITESAGVVGTSILLVAISVMVAVTKKGKIGMIKHGLKTVVLLLGLLGGIAFFNEHATKKIFALHRPCHTLLVAQTNQSIRLDSLYALPKKQKTVILQQIILTHEAALNYVDRNVLLHWVAESGYSFPSGHSLNAFLLASILACFLYSNTHYFFKLFFYAPFVWAILVAASRVTLGVHTALDVSAGALMGLLIALLLMVGNVLPFHKNDEEVRVTLNV